MRSREAATLGDIITGFGFFCLLRGVSTNHGSGMNSGSGLSNSTYFGIFSWWSSSSLSLSSLDISDTFLFDERVVCRPTWLEASWLVQGKE